MSIVTINLLGKRTCLSGLALLDSAQLSCHQEKSGALDKVVSRIHFQLKLKINKTEFTLN